MPLSVTKTDFRFQLAQLTNFTAIADALDTIDMTGVLTKTYYSVPYENGDSLVTIPLLSASDACDKATFSYDLTDFDAALKTVFTGWDDYFANYHGDSEVTNAGTFMLKEGLAVSSAVDAYYYSVMKKHFPAGCVFKPDNTLHCTFTYSLSTGIWTRVYSTQTFSGNTYDITSVAGTSTKPQVMSVKAQGGTSDVIKLLVKITYQTEGTDYVQFGYLEKLSGVSGYTNILYTAEPVLKVKTLEIMNYTNYDLKTVAIPDTTPVIVSYSTSAEDTGSLTAASPSSTTVTHGVVKTGDPDYKYVDSKDFYHSVKAIPDAGYYFTNWDSDATLNNNPTFTTEDNSFTPAFGTYNTVGIGFTLDGDAYTGTDVSYTVTCDSQNSGTYYSGNITINASYDASKYKLGTCTYSATGGASGSWTLGTPFALSSGQGTYTFTVVLTTVAVITFASYPLESGLSGYTIDFKPSVYSASGSPLLAAGDAVNISARLVDNLPSVIYAFKKWTGSSDYKATQAKTLAASNSYTAELVNLGASPTETSMTVSITTSSGGTIAAQDLTNLDASNLPVSLVVDTPYAVYVGAYVSFSLAVTGYTGTVAWFLDGAGTPFATTDTTQLDLPVTAGAHTVNCVVTA